MIIAISDSIAQGVWNLGKGGVGSGGFLQGVWESLRNAMKAAS